jgi:hypothetical protein
VQTSEWIWLIAWVRALWALIFATRRSRIASTFPSRVFAAPFAVPPSAARAALIGLVSVSV